MHVKTEKVETIKSIPVKGEEKQEKVILHHAFLSSHLMTDIYVL